MVRREKRKWARKLACFGQHAVRAHFRTAVPFALTVGGWAGMWAAALGLLGILPAIIPAIIFLVGLVSIPLFSQELNLPARVRAFYAKAKGVRVFCAKAKGILAAPSHIDSR